MSSSRRVRSLQGTVARRTLLRGAVAGGAVAIALPWLEIMDPPKKRAAAATAPKRVIFWFTANGSLPSIWTPPQGLNLDGHPIHAPLAPLKDKLLFLDGVDQKIAYESIGDGHQTGMACLLTNAEILPGTLFCEGECAAGNEQYVGWGGGISVDQYIAGEIAKQVTTRYSSLEMGVQVKSASVWSRLSYAGPDLPVPPREDPTQNFNDFFSDIGTDPFALELLKRKRKSVLDAVKDDYTAFNARLGKEDRVRLEQHLDGIRAVETSLDATSQFGEACGIPTVELPGGDFQQNDMYPLTGRAQMDLLVMALACDLTRVASLQWSTSVSNTRFTWLPLNLGEGHHDLSHYGDDAAAAQADIAMINQWYTEQFAYLLTKMSMIPEGDSNLLDNSVVVWVNELGQGNSHTRSDIPFILAGGCQGYFETGRVLSYDGAPHGQLLVSLTHAMDVPVDTFGVQQHSQGPLPGLTG
jgi:hypothetical protein